MSEILTRYQPFGWIAFVVTVFATPIAARIARRLGVMDMPDQQLKPHARPTPYLGGAAICLGWSAAVATAMFLGWAAWSRLLPIVLGGIAISIIGLADDVREIAPKQRLLWGAAIVAAVLLVTEAGWRLVPSVLAPAGWAIPAALAIPLSILISIFVVLGACNSANLIDGLNGLCTGVTAIISLGFFVLAAHLAFFQEEPGHPVRLVLAIAMFGATLGFLPLNFTGRIFMGDAGSMLLGYNCGIMILLFAEWGKFRWVVGALMIFALPVFDTALALFRRWRSGRSIFAGDRSHFYDQLVQRGLSVRQVVLICYLLTVAFAAIGLLVIWVRTRYAILIYVCVCLATAAAAWISGLTTPEEFAATSDDVAEAADAGERSG